MQFFLATVWHKWLRVPYKLHVRRINAHDKPRATLLFLHGIGNNGHAWDEVIARLPQDIQCITIDLLGFGESPKPHTVSYSAKTHARSVLYAYLSLAIPGKVIVVGHSLGSLIAVEFAKRYPLLVESLILVSPPFYQPEDPTTHHVLPRPDHMLKTIYRTVNSQPEEFVRVSGIAMKYKLINTSFSVTDANVASYMNTLQSAIVNQTSLHDIAQLTLPIRLIHGRLDPVVVSQNLSVLAHEHANITLTHTLAGHEVIGTMIPAVVQSIADATSRKKPLASQG